MHLGSDRVHNLIINRTKFLGDMVVGDSQAFFKDSIYIPLYTAFIVHTYVHKCVHTYIFLYI